MDVDEAVVLPPHPSMDEEQQTATILSIAQLAVDGSVPVLEAVTKLQSNLTEAVSAGLLKDKWKALYSSVIWMLGTQISPVSEDDQFPRKNFIDLVKDSIAHDLLDSGLLKAILELSTLVMLGLIKDEDGHQKRLIKLNTGVVYKQQKYNVEREETEGYSRLILLLRNMPLPPADIQDIVRSALAIIGQFDLEPNRVLDVTLDFFEQQPHNLSFVTLLKHFKVTNIVHILGFKFSHYQTRANPESTSQAAVEFEVVPDSLCLLAATLVAQQLVELDQLLPYLSPSLEETAIALRAKEEAVRKHLGSPSGLIDFLAGKPPSTSTSGSSNNVSAAAAAASNNTKISTTSSTSNNSNSGPNTNAAGAALLAAVATSSTPSAAATANTTTTTTNAANSTASTTSSTATSTANSTVVATATLPATAAFLQRPLKLRAGSAWRRAAVATMLPNPAVTTSSNVGRLTTAPTLSLTGSTSGSGSASATAGVTKSLTVLTSSSVAANAPSLGSGRVQREKEKEAREKEKQLEWEAEERILQSELSVFDRSQLRVFDEADVRRYPLLSLAAALLQSRCLDLGMTLLRGLTSASGVSLDFLLTYSVTLRDACVSLASFALQPLTRTLRSLPTNNTNNGSSYTNNADNGNSGVVQWLTPLKDLSELPLLQSQLLTPLSYHVASSTILLTMLCTLFKALIQKHFGLLLRHAEEREKNTGRTSNGSTSCSEEVQMVWTLARQLLLALSTTGADATFVSAQLWRALSLLPHTLRFHLYDSLRPQLLATQTDTVSSSTNTANSSNNATSNNYYVSVSRPLLGVSVAARTANKDIRNELKRLTKDNPRPTALKLAKLLQSHASIAAAAFLGLVESFDNFVPYCVEALKTCSELARDVFAHAMLCELKDKEDQRLDVADAQAGRPTPAWFSALSKFIAAFYAKYPSSELKGLLHYLLQSLAQQQRLGDLLLLKELVSVMGGCESLREVSAAQLQGLSGGRVLRCEVLGSAGATNQLQSNSAGTANSNNVPLGMQRKASASLRDTLLQTSQSAVPLLLFVSRLRDACALQSEKVSQLKVASQLADSAQDLLLQLTDFLVLDVAGNVSVPINNTNTITNTNATNNSRSLEAVARALPSLPTLLQELQLSPVIAFQLVRPLFRHNLLSNTSAVHTNISDTNTQNNTNSSSALSQWRLFSASVAHSVTHWLQQHYEADPDTALEEDIEEENDNNHMDADKNNTDENGDNIDGKIKEEEQQRKVAEKERRDIRKCLSTWWTLPASDYGDATTPLADTNGNPEPSAYVPESGLLQLYLWFWGLGLGDVHHPQERYTAEMKRIQDRLTDLEQRRQNASAATLNLSSSDFKKWQKAKDSEMLPLKTALSSLQEESVGQKQLTVLLQETLKSRVSSFIPTSWKNKPALVTDWLLQTLVLPRVTLGASEAVFCVQYVQMLHVCALPGLHLLQVLDALIVRLLATLYCSTQSEAACVGYALQEILSLTGRWQRSMQLYDSELKSKLLLCCPTATVTATATLTSAAATSTSVTTTTSTTTTAAAAHNKNKNSTTTSSQVLSERDRHTLVLAAATSYTKYLQLCRAWQTLLLTSLLQCLDSSEFMYLRCAMSLLARLVEQFPSRRSDGQTLLSRVEKLVEEEERNERSDLQLMARSLAVRLRRQASSWTNDLLSTSTSTANTASNGKNNKNSNDKNSNGKTHDDKNNKDKNSDKNNKINTTSNNSNDSKGIKNSATTTNSAVSGSNTKSGSSNAAPASAVKATVSTTSTANSGRSTSNSNSSSNNNNNNSGSNIRDTRDTTGRRDTSRDIRDTNSNNMNTTDRRNDPRLGSRDRDNVRDNNRDNNRDRDRDNVRDNNRDNNRDGSSGRGDSTNRDRDHRDSNRDSNRDRDRDNNKDNNRDNRDGRNRDNNNSNNSSNNNSSSVARPPLPPGQPPHPHPQPASTASAASASTSASTTANKTPSTTTNAATTNTNAASTGSLRNRLNNNKTTNNTNNTTNNSNNANSTTNATNSASDNINTANTANTDREKDRDGSRGDRRSVPREAGNKRKASDTPNNTNTATNTTANTNTANTIANSNANNTSNGNNGNNGNSVAPAAKVARTEQDKDVRSGRDRQTQQNNNNNNGTTANSNNSSTNNSSSNNINSGSNSSSKAVIAPVLNVPKNTSSDSINNTSSSAAAPAKPVVTAPRPNQLNSNNGNSNSNNSTNNNSSNNNNNSNSNSNGNNSSGRGANNTYNSNGNNSNNNNRQPPPPANPPPSNNNNNNSNNYRNNGNNNSNNNVRPPPPSSSNNNTSQPPPPPRQPPSSSNNNNYNNNNNNSNNNNYRDNNGNNQQYPPNKRPRR